MNPECAGLCGMVLMLMQVTAIAQSAPVPSEQHDVVFDAVTPLASNAEIVRRMMTPLAGTQLHRTLMRGGRGLREQPITPEAEEFTVFVPAHMPENGYGLLVFIQPGKAGNIPTGWKTVLEKKGMIFVSAENSGNDAAVMDRRVPLALLGVVNVTTRYQIDPQRVFVGGMSGGSRVAQFLALAYPDVFSGALLNAGADPLAGRNTPLPPRDLFMRFQENMRLVYLSGAQDASNLATDTASIASMRSWCVFNLERRTMPKLGHETADARSLSWALDALSTQTQADSKRLHDCRTRIETELASRLDRVDQLRQQGQRGAARTLLYETDKQFGGLAAPRSIELDAALTPP